SCKYTIETHGSFSNSTYAPEFFFVFLNLSVFVYRNVDLSYWTITIRTTIVANIIADACFHFD
ncbi:unnamed protein product, partial [Prunus brigantina]